MHRGLYCVYRNNQYTEDCTEVVISEEEEEYEEEEEGEEKEEKSNVDE